MQRFRELIVRDGIDELEKSEWPREILTSPTVCEPSEFPLSFKLGQSALHAACARPESPNNTRVVKWLLAQLLPIQSTQSNTFQAQSIISQPSVENFTTLHSAALAGNTQAAKILLDLSPSPAKLILEATTPAPTPKTETTVETNPNQKCAAETKEMVGVGVGLRVLDLACAGGNVGMVEFLLGCMNELKMDRSMIGFGCVAATILYAPNDEDWIERIDILDRLQKFGFDLMLKDSGGQTICHYLATRPSHSQDDAIWNFLTKCIAWNVADVFGESPLHVACRYRQLSAIRVLLKCPAAIGDLFRPNQFGQYPHHLLFQAPEQTFSEFDEECVRLVLETQGSGIGCILIDINRPVLHFAIQPSGVSASSTAASAGVIGSGGCTVLHRAIELKCSWALVQMLVDGGADWHVKNSDNKTPLELAVRINPELVVQIFCQQERTITNLLRELRHLSRNSQHPYPEPLHHIPTFSTITPPPPPPSQPLLPFLVPTPLVNDSNHPGDSLFRPVSF